MNSCESFELQLPAYAAGELSEDAAANVRAHLETCGSCREQAESLRLLHGAMAMSPLPEKLDANRVAAIAEEFRAAQQKTAPRSAAIPSVVVALLRSVASRFRKERAPVPVPSATPFTAFARFAVFVAVPLLFLALFMPATRFASKNARLASAAPAAVEDLYVSLLDGRAGEKPQRELALERGNATAPSEAARLYLRSTADDWKETSRAEPQSAAKGRPVIASSQLGTEAKSRGEKEGFVSAESIAAVDRLSVIGGRPSAPTAATDLKSEVSSYRLDLPSPGLVAFATDAKAGEKVVNNFSVSDLDTVALAGDRNLSALAATPPPAASMPPRVVMPPPVAAPESRFGNGQSGQLAAAPPAAQPDTYRFQRAAPSEGRKSLSSESRSSGIADPQSHELAFAGRDSAAQERSGSGGAIANGTIVPQTPLVVAGVAVANGNVAQQTPVVVNGGTLFDISRNASAAPAKPAEPGQVAAQTAKFAKEQLAEMSGEFDNAARLKKSGAGTLSLDGGNTYRGATTISGGTVVLGGETADGTTSLGLEAAPAAQPVSWEDDGRRVPHDSLADAASPLVMKGLYEGRSSGGRSGAMKSHGGVGLNSPAAGAPDGSVRVADELSESSKRLADRNGRVVAGTDFYFDLGGKDEAAKAKQDEPKPESGALVANASGASGYWHFSGGAGGGAGWAGAAKPYAAAGKAAGGIAGTAASGLGNARAPRKQEELARPSEGDFEGFDTSSGLISPRRSDRESLNFGVIADKQVAADFDGDGLANNRWDAMDRQSADKSSLGRLVAENEFVSLDDTVTLTGSGVIAGQPVAERRRHIEVADARTKAKEETVALQTDYPKPMFVGTPAPIKMPNMQPSSGPGQISRSYSVSKEAMEKFKKADGYDGLAQHLEEKGVKTPAGSKATYDAETEQLVVTSTPQGLSKFDDVLSDLEAPKVAAPTKPATRGGAFIGMESGVAEPSDDFDRLLKEIAGGAASTTPQDGSKTAAEPQSRRKEEVKTVRGSLSLNNKLESIFIPEINFRQANISDVVNFLNEASREADPDKTGVNMVLNFNVPGGGSVPESTVPNITLSLRRVSLMNAIKYVSEVAGLHYRLDDGAIVITPANIVSGPVVTREYKMGKAAYDLALSSGAASDPTKFFQNAGVPFPMGSSLRYDPNSERLIVANTPDNLEKFDQILASIQTEPARPAPPRKAAGFNPYIESTADAFSTFSIDVDTASYTLTRRAIEEGRLPDAEQVRTEEIVNAFDYDYAPPSRGSFAMHAQLAPSPFRAPLELLKVGIQGRLPGRDAKKAAVLTLVIDTSGSMDTADRLGRIRAALKMLAGKLQPQDSIAIVAFNTEARLLLDRTAGSDKARILSAIDSLSASGSTQLEGGMRLAYEVAARGFVSGAANRVILMSDGVANLGAATAQEILASVEVYRKQGIYLTVLGFGSGAYDDQMLMTLADKGDGMYAFVDSDEEARRLLVDQWEQTMHVIAKDVKIQIEFNPDRVVRWRQIGYEKRQLTKQDFRNDSVDAGEVGSGQAVTALYDIELKNEQPMLAGLLRIARTPIATVRVRYKDPDTGKVTEIEQRVTDANRIDDFAKAPVRFRVAACASEFAELLRVSPYTAGSDFAAVIEQLRPAAAELPLDQRVQELMRMAERARNLTK